MPGRLPHRLVVKLGKLLGMLGSDHDGEIAAAARAANQLLRSAGLTWAELLSLPPEAIAAPVHKVDCDDLLTWGGLSELERRFTLSLRGFRRLTPKQEAVLQDIISKRDAEAA